jgi:hypothetical protein
MALIVLVAAVSAPVQAQVVKDLSVVPDAPTITVRGAITGRDFVDYKVKVEAGKKLRVDLQASNGATYFNILAPGSQDVGIYNSSTEGNSFHKVVGTTGNYRVRVYLMSSAGRRNEQSNYTMELQVKTPQGQGAPHGDARVHGTNYHATGNVPCRMVQGQPTGSCVFGVVRHGSGSADVTITKQDGGTRTIFFKGGQAIGCDQSQADWGGDFRAKKEADLFIVHIGQERYEIPEAVVFGG